MNGSGDYFVSSVNGPVVSIGGGRGLGMYDMVYVGGDRLIGEVVALEGDRATVQVYEETTGVMPGQPVVGLGGPMTVTLGPGLIGGIFDGIARPLVEIEKQSGAFIARGLNPEPLNTEALWEVEVLCRPGDKLAPGAVYASCPELGVITHRVTVAPGLSGTVVSAMPSGSYRVNDVIAVLDTENGPADLTLCHKWPIRQPRPFEARMSPSMPLVTGQRVLDTFFPVAKGGCAAIPGPFGAGKTMTQHQLAKWSDADMIVYIGCGERGNEMTQVLDEFSQLTDPKTGRKMTERTILIANTSNMPVAAREASIYTGVTIAEYYRDMGYHVAIMADSTSRWAEALREISGRLEEMPAEEGFPAYLPSRLAEFYERAGYVRPLSGGEGSITIIGAVSPQGGDFSEPVTQNTKRFIRAFWALDRQLAYTRHFPSINWMTSYSEYFQMLTPWYVQRYGQDFIDMRGRLMELLQEESRLMEIVKLIGADVLPDDQKLIVETARVIRVGFLQQNAYHETDTYVRMDKQKLMMEVILRLYDKARELVETGIPVSQLKDTGIFEDVIKIKYEVPNDRIEDIRQIGDRVDKLVLEIMRRN